MCERCNGEPYRGVRALFNGDFQSRIRFDDRHEWMIVSPTVIVHMGESAIRGAEPIVRVCDMALSQLTDDEVTVIHELGNKLNRTPFGEA